MTKDPNGVVVVGAGLAGLAAAAELARAGIRVTVLERSHEPGGRAVTHEEAGFRFNLGPHALAPDAKESLRRLGVSVHAYPTNQGGLAFRQGRLHQLPISARRLMTTWLFSPAAKWQAARALKQLGALDPALLMGVSVAAWLRDWNLRPSVREFFEALARVATYANAPEALSAGALVAMLQMAFKGIPVAYIGGGWQSIVDGLAGRAWEDGAILRAGARVSRVQIDGETRAVELADGAVLPAAAIILTGGPREIQRLLPPDVARRLDHAVAAAPPAFAACLDLGLAGLPRPERTFALGMDTPLYYSVHSGTVPDLAPPGGAMLHLAKYLPPEETDPAQDRAELEAFLDVLQPGWRREMRVQRFLPHMTVTHAVPAAAFGGFRGRPRTDHLDVPGVFLAGDWVGPRSQLSGASLASAADAAQAAIVRAGVRGVAPPARAAG